MKRFLQWRCAITFGAVLIASPLVAQDDPDALMADAISLYSTAMEVRGEERHQLLQQVDGMLSRIRTEFPDSAPASIMQLGIPLGPIDLNSLEAELTASEPKLADRLSGELAEQWRILQKRSPDVAAIVEETLIELSGSAVDETKGELYVRVTYYIMAAFYYASDTAFGEFFDPTEAGQLYRVFVGAGGLEELGDIGASTVEDIAVGVALDFATSTIADFVIEIGPEMGASTQTLVRAAIKATITEVLLAVQASKDPSKIPGLGIKRVSELIEIITTTRGLAADVDRALAQTALRMQTMAQMTASYRDQEGVQNIISSTRKNLVVELEGAVGKDDAKAVSDIMLLGWAALTAEFEGETERAQDLHKVILLRGNVDTMPTIWNAPDLLTYFANAFTDSPKRAAEIMVGLTELSKYSKALEPMEAVTTPSTSSELASTQIAPGGFLGAPIPNTPSEPEFVMGKWSIQEEPDFRLKAGEQSGGFEISKEGQISFSGAQLFGDYRTPEEWHSLAVFINKKQTRAMALAMGDGAERFSLVDLEERKVLNDKPLPFWMYGPTDDVIWDPSDRYVALSVPMAEYSKGLGVFDLETGQYSIIPSREFDASANDYWLLESLYTEDDGRVSISVALQRFNADGSPMRSDNTPPQKRTLDLTDFFVNLSDADSIKFVFPKEELDHVATLSNDGELRSTGFNVDISDRLSVNCTHWVTQGAGAASEYGITTWQALLPKLQCNVWSDNDDGSSGLVSNIEVSAMLANDGAMIVKLADAEYFHNKRQGNLGQCAFSIQNQVFDYKKDWLAECPSESTISTTRIEPADLDVVQSPNAPDGIADQAASGSGWSMSDGLTTLIVGVQASDAVVSANNAVTVFGRQALPPVNATNPPDTTVTVAQGGEYREVFQTVSYSDGWDERVALVPRDPSKRIIAISPDDVFRFSRRVAWSNDGRFAILQYDFGEFASDGLLVELTSGASARIKSDRQDVLHSNILLRSLKDLGNGIHSVDFSHLKCPLSDPNCGMATTEDAGTTTVKFRLPEATASEEASSVANQVAMFDALPNGTYGIDANMCARKDENFQHTAFRYFRHLDRPDLGDRYGQRCNIVGRSDVDGAVKINLSCSAEGNLYDDTVQWRIQSPTSFTDLDAYGGPKNFQLCEVASQATSPPTISEWTSEIVHIGGYGRVELERCISGREKSTADCLRDDGASEETVRFAEARSREGGEGPEVPVHFEELGRVDLAFLDAFSMSQNEWEYFVNTSPKSISEPMYPDRDLKDIAARGDRTAQSILRQFPGAASWKPFVAGMRQLPNGHQRFSTVVYWTENCRACPIVGYNVANVDFDQTGRLRAYEYRGVFDNRKHGKFLSITPDDLRTNRAAVQLQLNIRGYDAGPMDGTIGPRTRKAIADFQRENGINRGTGQLDSRTLASLADRSTNFKNGRMAKSVDFPPRMFTGKWSTENGCTEKEGWIEVSKTDEGNLTLFLGNSVELIKVERYDGLSFSGYDERGGAIDGEITGDIIFFNTGGGAETHEFFRCQGGSLADLASASVSQGFDFMRTITLSWAGNAQGIVGEFVVVGQWQDAGLRLTLRNAEGRLNPSARMNPVESGARINLLMSAAPRIRCDGCRAAENFETVFGLRFENDRLTGPYESMSLLVPNAALESHDEILMSLRGSDNKIYITDTVFDVATLLRQRHAGSEPPVQSGSGASTDQFTAGLYNAPDGYKWLQIASRPDLEAARAFVAEVVRAGGGARIFQTSNGWFAITATSPDPMFVGNEEENLSSLRSVSWIPSDAFFVEGESYVTEFPIKNGDELTPAFTITTTNRDTPMLALDTFRGEWTEGEIVRAGDPIIVWGTPSLETGNCLINGHEGVWLACAHTVAFENSAPPATSSAPAQNELTTEDFYRMFEANNGDNYITRLVGATRWNDTPEQRASLLLVVEAAISRDEEYTATRKASILLDVMHEASKLAGGDGDLFRIMNYARNSKNGEHPSIGTVLASGSSWQEVDDKAKEFHVIGYDNPDDVRKFTHPDGREAVFFRDQPTGQWEIMHDGTNDATYNLVNGSLTSRNDFYQHMLLDVVPWIVYGVSPDDQTSFKDRLETFEQSGPLAVATRLYPFFTKTGAELTSEVLEKLPSESQMTGPLQAWLLYKVRTP
ncbi:peptidoglycan-binding domain-containing protein [Roseovarius sp. ZX-A-9]|uniref:peptidoglycan-binding domain-containing protein n=1 Tax=Roseovarius sp. ZX-A-9 TaxID=3014783 RepID=UPI0023313BFD|nr:peptidoglycan-binding domain-containing protein [Roseovarius sp. ZX-A-9]